MAAIDRDQLDGINKPHPLHSHGYSIIILSVFLNTPHIESLALTVLDNKAQTSLNTSALVQPLIHSHGPPLGIRVH